jgi:DNA (cytosine-5)-methyltransferase 1
MYIISCAAFFAPSLTIPKSNDTMFPADTEALRLTSMKNGTNGIATIPRAKQRLSQKTFAALLEPSPTRIARWERVDGGPKRPRAVWFRRSASLSDVDDSDRVFTFVDLFAGIGGTRLGFEVNGGKCIFTCEWNEQSRKTYLGNFCVDHAIRDDIRNIAASEIPNHDVLVAGFPCQPFSIAGVSKKNALGDPHGFECKTQGTLFFELARIIKEKRPAAFLLENVKNLERHDRGRTFQVIRETLEVDLGYHVTYRIIDAKCFLPQHRERIFIVGFRDQVPYNWDELKLPRAGNVKLGAILHPEDGSEEPEEPYTVGRAAKVNKKYTLTDHLWQYLQSYAEKHRAKGNGFGFGLVGRDDVARTLSARYYKDGSEVLIDQGRRNPRRLTPRECARLMGFPDSFRIQVSDTQAYKQFGNSVAVPVIAAIAGPIKAAISALRSKDGQCAASRRLRADIS